MEGTRKCSKCREFKTTKGFGLAERNKTAATRVCKECMTSLARAPRSSSVAPKSLNRLDVLSLVGVIGEDSSEEDVPSLESSWYHGKVEQYDSNKKRHRLR